MIEYSDEQIIEILNQDVEKMEKNGDTIILYMSDGTKIWAIIKYIKTINEQKEMLEDEIRILNYNLDMKNSELNNLVATYGIIEVSSSTETIDVLTTTETVEEPIN